MLNDDLVPRPRLTGHLATQTRVVVCAPAGFGKTALASQSADVIGARFVWVPASPLGVAPTVAVLRRSVRAARLGPLDVVPGQDPLDAAADALAGLLADTDTPVLVALDDAHLADPSVPLALATAVTAPHHLVILTRRELSLKLPPTVTLGPGDLAFTADEVASLAGDRSPGQADAIWRSTAGWPAGVVAALRSHRDVALSSISLTAWFDQVDAADRGAALVLARLTMVTPLVVDAVAGPGAWERFIEAGLPVVAEPDGRTRVPRVVADALATRGPIDSEALQRGARAMAAEGSVLDAATALADAGEVGRAADLLAGLPAGAAELLDPSEWLALVDLLGPAADTRPEVLLGAAQALELSVQIEARASLVARAARAARTGPIANAAEAEAVRDLVLAGDAEQAARRGRELLDQLGSDELHSRVRVLGALGRLAAWSGDLSEAEAMLQRAATLAGRQGDPSNQAQLLAWLGHSVHLAAGDRARAVAALERARDLCPPGSRRGALSSILLAEVHAAFGDSTSTRAALAQAAPVLATTTDQRLVAYAAWQRAVAAALDGDGDETRAAIAEVERNPGEWFAHPTGTEFMAQAVDLLRRVHDLPGAVEMLERATARVVGTPLDDIVIAARGALEATDGDPVVAEGLLSRSIDSPELATRERWRIHLLRAAAARRRGDAATAEELRRRSRAARGELDAADARRIEPVAWDLVEGSGLAADTPAAASVVGGSDRVIRLLGPFEVVDGGSDLTPVGQSAALLAFVALHRTVSVERVVDHFWPDSDAEVGRRRLRNLLNRLRDQTPGFVERTGEALVVASGVVVDVERFDADADLAINGHDMAAAARALATYRGELLPVELYDDWVARQRARLARRCCDVAERWSSSLAADGDIGRALVVLERALEADPYDEDRWLRAARLARDAGQPGRARALLAEASAALAELGLEPGSTHRELSHQLRTMLTEPSAG